VWIGLQNDSHCGIAGFVDRSAGIGAQFGDGFGIGGSNAKVGLQRVESDVEQNPFAIPLAQCAGVSADFGPLVLVPGGHYSPYIEEFERATSAAISWFRQHL
jgi:hypothetical protein